MNRILCYGVNIGGETIFTNINRLDSGEFLKISKGDLSVNKYWTVGKIYLKLIDITDVRWDGFSQLFKNK